MLALHPSSQRLARSLLRCMGQPTSWSGHAYRSSSVAYANRDDLITGAGSKSAGGRWNPPGAFEAVYTSLDPHTALDEALAHFRHYRLPIESAMPRVIVSLEVCLRHILDLTSGEIRRRIKVSERRLLGEPWRELRDRKKEAITQAIGRLAWEGEWEGLLVPSAARPRGLNLIYFPGNLRTPDSWIRIINRSQLPPPQTTTA